MSTFRLKLAGLALITALGASAAHAQSYPSLFGKQRAAVTKTAPAVKIEQEGRGNGAAAGQHGRNNQIGIGQKGQDNTGQVQQTGNNNTAGIYQVGRNNDGTITQTGDNNTACLVQVGRNQSADINQTGGQSTGVFQTPKGSYAIPAELCEANAAKAKAVRWVLGRVY